MLRRWLSIHICMSCAVFVKPAWPGNYLIKTELYAPDSSTALSSQGPNVLRKFQSIYYFKRIQNKTNFYKLFSWFMKTSLVSIYFFVFIISSIFIHLYRALNKLKYIHSGKDKIQNSLFVPKNRNKFLYKGFSLKVPYFSANVENSINEVDLNRLKHTNIKKMALPPNK